VRGEGNEERDWKKKGKGTLVPTNTKSQTQQHHHKKKQSQNSISAPTYKSEQNGKKSKKCGET